MSDEPKVEKNVDQSPEHINIKVSSQSGMDMHFKIKDKTPLRKMFDAFCSKQGMSQNSVRFLFNGERVMPHQTPGELKMEDGDVIDAVLMQTGGSSFN